MSFWKGCSICGPHWFHRWWCPELLRSIDILAIGLGVVSVAVLVAGRTPSHGWPIAVLIAGGAALADVAIRIGVRCRRRRLR